MVGLGLVAVPAQVTNPLFPVSAAACGDVTAVKYLLTAAATRLRDTVATARPAR